MNDDLFRDEQEFFLIGAKTYLDVLEAIDAFRERAQKRCRETVESRLQELAAACRVDWGPKDLDDSFGRVGAVLFNSDNVRHVGVALKLERFGGLAFYFCAWRRDQQACWGTGVELWRKSQRVAPDLWKRAPANRRSRNSLPFVDQLTESDIAAFERQLDKAIDEFVAFIDEAGGLRQYLSADSPVTS
jgi:hypothetical protein